MEKWIGSPSVETENALAFTIHWAAKSADRLAEVSVKRPGLGRRRALHEASVAIVGLWDYYRTALTTNDPAEAQRLSRQAQSVIDNAWTPITVAAEYEAAAEILGDLSTPIAERMLAAVRHRRPSVNLKELLTVGAVDAARAIGRPVERNSGLAFCVLEIVGDVQLDPRLLRSKLRVAVDLTDMPRRLVEIAGMTGAVEALSGSHRDSFEAFFAYQAVASVTTDKRALVRETGRLVARLFEAALPVFAWYTLIAGTAEGPDAFERMLGENAANLAVQLARGDGAALFADAQRFLRDAPNHGRAFDYDERSDEVSINLGSFAGTMALDDYIDKALAFLETLLAAVWGLEASLEASGRPLMLNDVDASFIGLTPVALARMAFAETNGLEIRSVTETAGVVSFSIDATDADLLIAGMVTAKMLVSVAAEFVVTAGAQACLEFSLSDWPSMQGEPIQQMMQMVRFKERGQVDGVSQLVLSELRFVAGCLARATADGDVRCVALLREVRGWADSRGWREEANFCSRAIRLAREQCTDADSLEIAQMVRSGSQPRLPRASSLRIHL
jgi:hypothetical protein